MSEALDQPLWYNDQIRRSNKMWFIDQAHNMGMDRARDIYDTFHGHFYSAIEIQQRFGPIMNFIICNRYVASIPSMWRIILRQRIIK